MSTETAPDPQSNNMTMTTEKETSLTPQIDQAGKGPNKTSAVALYKSKTTKTALDRLEENIGGREALVDTIGLASLDKKQEHFLRLLCDPARAHDSLVTIARDSGLLPTNIMALFRDAAFAKAHTLAMGQLSEAVPAIVKDITDKSVDAKIECPNCFGEGFIDEGVKCGQCSGRGQVMRTSDIDRQKIALEAAGVLRKGPGVSVNVQQNVGVSTGGATLFSKYVKASDETAYDVSDIIDAEPVK